MLPKPGDEKTVALLSSLRQIVDAVQPRILREDKFQRFERALRVYVAAENFVAKSYALAARVDDDFVLAERLTYPQRMNVYLPRFARTASADYDFAETAMKNGTLASFAVEELDILCIKC